VYDAVWTYSVRALQCANALNSNADEPMKEAILEALDYDNDASVKAAAPYRGIPLSCSDELIQAGADCTLGFAVRCFEPAPADGVLLASLRAAGFIPFVRSNGIQRGPAAFETHTLMFGRVENPWNRARSA
jgi:amidase